jgi:hypothetical protein
VKPLLPLLPRLTCASCDSRPVPTSFLSWKIALDALRAEAIKHTVDDPLGAATAEARSLAREGTRFLGDQEKLAGWMDEARRAARAGRLGASAGLPPPPARTIYGWRVLLSRYRLHAEHYAWHLSAKLEPPGRASTERDWQMLGKIAKYLGAPCDPLTVPENPNDAHHWRWNEEYAAAPPPQTAPS